MTPTPNYLFIKNLDNHLDDDGLEMMFHQFGDIVSAKVAVDRFAQSKGFGFVRFERAEDAQKAIRYGKAFPNCLQSFRQAFIIHNPILSFYVSLSFWAQVKSSIFCGQML